MFGEFSALINFGVEIWMVVATMAPYLLLGFFLAGLLSVFVTAERVEAHLGGPGWGPIVKAAIWGIPLPICSCGVLPLGASLKRHGASSGATVSFLISTPQTGVDSLLVTYSLLGPVFAIFRPLVALVSGLLGGLFVAALAGPDREEVRASSSHCACCANPDKKAAWQRALIHGFVTIPADLGRPLLWGLVAAGGISVLLPADYFSSQAGGGVVAMLVMMVLGLPLYVCATASVPLAVVLLAKGVSPGAALVFLMVGPATNMTSLITLWRVLGKKDTLLYLAAVALTALGSGLFLDLVFAWQGGVLESDYCRHEEVALWDHLSGILLLLLLALPFLRKWLQGKQQKS